jgi:hypothetical protein
MSVGGRRANHNFVDAGFGDEGVSVLVIEREFGGWEGEGESFLFAGLEREPLEAAELFGWARHAGGELAGVELDNFVAGARSGVFDVYGGGDGAALGEPFW